MPDEIWFGKDGLSTPSRETFLCELKNDGVLPRTIIPFSEGWHNQEADEEVKSLMDGKLFTSPKPTKLLNLLLRIANCDRGAIILDFFSGNATTAHAVMKLNTEDGGKRKFIMVQLPEVTDEKSEARKAGYETIWEIGKERIRRAGKKIVEELVGTRYIASADKSTDDSKSSDKSTDDSKSSDSDQTARTRYIASLPDIPCAQTGFFKYGGCVLFAGRVW